jgi:hypothetical protein
VDIQAHPEKICRLEYSSAKKMKEKERFVRKRYVADGEAQLEPNTSPSTN